MLKPRSHYRKPPLALTIIGAKDSLEASINSWCRNILSRSASFGLNLAEVEEALNALLRCLGLTNAAKRLYGRPRAIITYNSKMDVKQMKLIAESLILRRKANVCGLIGHHPQICSVSSRG